MNYDFIVCIIVYFRLDLSIYIFYGIIFVLLDLILLEISLMGCKGLRYIDGLLIFKLLCLYEIINIWDN